MPISLPSGASTSTTCLASSRVGTSTSAVGCPGTALSSASGASGSPNASVLPEPVLGLAAHVVAGERVGDGGLLDGEGVVDALGREGVDELGREAEIRERLHAEVPLTRQDVDWPRTRWLHTTVGNGRKR